MNCPIQNLSVPDTDNQVRRKPASYKCHIL